jgi:1-acyl-sn-glycerol-3-phosphate acyltransferase
MFYNILKKFFIFLFVFFARWEVQGKENIPKEGSVILAANHVSYWDPIIVGCICPRVVRFMAKKELFSYFIFGKILKSIYAFPVDRKKSDREAIKAALTVLKNNEVLGMFPEGMRVKNKKLGEFKQGMAMIALKTQAPIVPIAIKNSEKIFSKGWFRSFQVIIGEPVVYNNKIITKKYKSEDIKELTNMVRKIIEKNI